MRDEMDGRIWAEHHEAYSNGVTALIETLKASFTRLNAIQFDAPWRQSTKAKPDFKA